MPAYMDVIGSVVAGTFIIITIIYSIFNIQRMNHNISTLLLLNNTANTMTDVIDLMYLEPVARNLGRDEEAIIRATSNEFRFRKRVVDEGDLMEYHLQTVADASGNISFIVREVNAGVTGTGTEVFNSAPFFIQSGDVFSYFNRHGNPTDTLSAIHGIKVDFVYVKPGWNAESDEILYPITFWRYFKNIYLRTFR